MSKAVKYDLWIIRILVIAGLGCSVLYSERLFDGTNTIKTLYFYLIICLVLSCLSVMALRKKKCVKLSMTLPDILFALYVVWAFVRLFTSDTDSVHNLYFSEFLACVIWYYALRFFFSVPIHKDWLKQIYFILMAFGYIQFIFCALQLAGIIPSFSPISPVSGTFNNTSKLCIYLTCMLPLVVQTGLMSHVTTSTGKLVRVASIFYVLGWIALVLAMGSRTSILSGFIGMCVFIFFKTGLARYLKGNVGKLLLSTAILLLMCTLVVLLMHYKKDSANGRLLIWKVAGSGIREAPLQGHGFNAFQTKYEDYQAAYFQQQYNQKESMIADNMIVAMNDYIETAFNLGVVGLLLYIGFWLSLFHEIDFKTITRDTWQLVSITTIVIFLVASGFYFVSKMLSVKVVVLFFAAYISSVRKNIFSINIRIMLLRLSAVTALIFCCISVQSLVIKTEIYAQWQKANILHKFECFEDARIIYEKISPDLLHDAQFVYCCARNLFENKAYSECIELMEKAKAKITGVESYCLLGDAYAKTRNYEKSLSYYKYASQLVPNRFRPLYQQFKLYETLGDIPQALLLAHVIVKKPVKVDSCEVQQMIKECIDFIKLKAYEPEN